MDYKKNIKRMIIGCVLCNVIYSAFAVTAAAMVLA